MTTHSELNQKTGGKDLSLDFGALSRQAYASMTDAADASADGLDYWCGQAVQMCFTAKNRVMPELRRDPEKFARGLQVRAEKIVNVVVPALASVPGRELNQIRQEPVRLVKRAQDTAAETAARVVIIGGTAVASAEAVPAVAGGIGAVGLMAQLNPHDVHNVARQHAVKTVVEDIANNKSAARIKKDMNHLLQEVDITPIQNLLFKKITR